MAGLPKSVFALLSALGIVIALALTGVADGIQTDSVVLPLGDVQTSSNVLQPVFDLIDANVNADPIDKANLKADFETAVVTLGLLAPEQAMAMLSLVQWEMLLEPDALANAAAAIQTILADLISGAPIGDPVEALQRLLNLLSTPAGTLNAIRNAGASDEILAEVASLVADGVPPGILVRITKQGLRDGFSVEESSAQLDALAAAVAEGGDVSWGQIANAVTEKGNSKHQEQEQSESVEGSAAAGQEASERSNETKVPDREKNEGKEKDRDSTRVEQGHSSEQLDTVATATAEGEDGARGQIANDVTGKGSDKHQEQEQVANIEQSEEPEQQETGTIESSEEPEQQETGAIESSEEPEQVEGEASEQDEIVEPEQEETEHGRGNDKKDDSPSTDNKKDKDK